MTVPKKNWSSAAQGYRRHRITNMSAFKTTTSTYSTSARSDDCAALYSSATPTEPAICIPRVFPNITRRRILAIFKNLGLGDVCRIDMVPRVAHDGNEFFRVFVHIAWFENDNAVDARRALLADEEVKIMYDDPWFWKLRKSNSKGPHEKLRRPAPRIVLDKPALSAAAEKVMPVSEKPIVQASDRVYEDDVQAV